MSRNLHHEARRRRQRAEEPIAVVPTHVSAPARPPLTFGDPRCPHCHAFRNSKRHRQCARERAAGA